MNVVAFMPTAEELFPFRDATVDDLRALQANPAYHNMIQQLRSAAYICGATENLEARGLRRALDTMGFIEFSIQKADEEEKAGNNGPALASDIGFTDED